MTGSEDEDRQPSEASRAQQVGRGTLVAAMAVALLGQALVLLDPIVSTPHFEETANIAQAVAWGWLPLEWWYQLQHRPFCGGCSLLGAAAAPGFALLGAKVWVWKATLLVLSSLGLAACMRQLAHAFGRAGVWMMALSWGAMPGVMAALSLRGWGNHAEASTLGMVALMAAMGPADRAKPWFVGVVAGLAVWAGWSASPLAAVAVGLAAWRAPATWPKLVAGAVLGLMPWAVYVGFTGEFGFDNLAMLASDGTVWDKFAELVGAVRVAEVFGPDVRGFGDDRIWWLHEAGAVAVGASVMAVLWRVATGTWTVRAPMVAAVLAVFAYLVSPFALEPAGVYRIESSRYLAPALVLVPWMLAHVAADAWTAKRRRVAVCLLAAPLMVAALDRGAKLHMGGLAQLDAQALDLTTWWEHDLRGPRRIPLDAWTCAGDADCEATVAQQRRQAPNR